ncbi:nitrate- and nitrite sensing domain-containing protein [Streptomyces sp. NPDC048664]|uniref:sensor histidine kinase n=1 Tax=Streptomyces sp. NPDC048664 TaxID=3154505 RepID=UPI0034134A30
MPGNRDRRTRHRSAPRRSLRTSFVLPFVVPAVCLTGLWGYTATGLVDEHIHSQAEADRDTSLAGPAQALVTALQSERRLTAVWQTGHGGAARADLAAARTKTDAAMAAYRAAPGADTPAVRRGAKALDGSLTALGGRRDTIDKRRLSAPDTFRYFTDAVAQGISLVGVAVRGDDGSLSQGGSATVSLMRITETLSRQDALLSGALPSRGMSATSRAQFAQYLALQREFGAALAAGDLPRGTAARYARITDGGPWATLGSVGDAVAANRSEALPAQASSWTQAADGVLGDLQALNADAVQGLADDASDRADDLLLGMLLGTAATLAALVGGAVLALRSRRATRARVSDLHTHTEELARTLPQLLARMNRGERIEPTATAARGGQGEDDLERLAGAIDQLGRVAAASAVHQSQGREGTEKIFAQLIRRTQILIHRLISLLDDLERKHEDSDLLKDIFKVDHLATRVRRHAENLVILSSSPPSRRMTAAVSITDVMRSAVAETEQYTRVKVKNLPADRRVALAGRAVADVTHLLAELIENGTSFSPPDTQVFVSATKVAKGLVIHVEDHGLGIQPDTMAYANDLLAHPPRLNMTSLGEDPRLGHFVVARLADRHQIKVELRESVYGGTLAVVLLPSALLEEHRSPVLDHLKTAVAAAGLAVDEGARQAAALGTQDGALAGVAAASAGDASGTLTHSRTPDHSGFPEYGGAGLLPPASEHPVPPEQPEQPDRWEPAARAQEAPASRPRSAARPQAPGAAGGHPGSWGGHAGPGPSRTRGAGLGAPGSGSASGSAEREVSEPGADGPLTTPQVLPQRTRGASLAQQLRREAEQAQGRPEGEADNGVISPDASARAMIAIQQGLKRARMSETDEPAAGTDAWPSDSGDSGAHRL